MNTIWALLLVTTLNGQAEIQVVDHNLTLTDCFEQLGQRIQLPGGNTVTLECRREDRLQAQ